MLRSNAITLADVAVGLHSLRRPSLSSPCSLTSSAVFKRHSLKASGKAPWGNQYFRKENKYATCTISLQIVLFTDTTFKPETNTQYIGPLNSFDSEICSSRTKKMKITNQNRYHALTCSCHVEFVAHDHNQNRIMTYHNLSIQIPTSLQTYITEWVQKTDHMEKK